MEVFFYCRSIFWKFNKTLNNFQSVSSSKWKKEILELKKLLNSLLCQRTHMQKKCKKMWKCYLILDYKANSYVTTPSVTENCQVLESPVVFLPSYSFHSSLELPIISFYDNNFLTLFTNVLQVCIPKQYHKVLFAFEVDIYISNTSCLTSTLGFCL